jgi:hypothetical protein
MYMAVSLTTQALLPPNYRGLFEGCEGCARFEGLLRMNPRNKPRRGERPGNHAGTHRLAEEASLHFHVANAEVVRLLCAGAALAWLQAVAALHGGVWRGREGRRDACLGGRAYLVEKADRGCGGGGGAAEDGLGRGNALQTAAGRRGAGDAPPVAHSRGPTRRATPLRLWGRLAAAPGASQRPGWWRAPSEMWPPAGALGVCWVRGCLGWWEARLAEGAAAPAWEDRMRRGRVPSGVTRPCVGPLAGVATGGALNPPAWPPPHLQQGADGANHVGRGGDRLQRGPHEANDGLPQQGQHADGRNGKDRGDAAPVGGAAGLGAGRGVKRSCGTDGGRS